MAGPEHERVGGTLYLWIIDKIASLPGHTWRSIEPICSTRFSVPGARSKEGDEAFGPSTRVGRDAWPSVVMEVGYSETESQLEMDAYWWLTKSVGKTRFVITVKVNRNPFELKIDCYMMAPPDYFLRNPATLISRRVQNFRVDAAGNIDSDLFSTKLHIPYSCIFDEVDGNPGDIEFSLEEIREFALDRFHKLA